MRAAMMCMVLILAGLSLVDATGMRCRGHPLYHRGLKGEMICAWTYAPRGGRQYWTLGQYIPRNRKYNFQVVGKPHRHRHRQPYLGLDYFLTGFNGEDTKRFLTVYYQRRARTYLLLHMYHPTLPRVTVPGWRPEGWVRRAKGPPGLEHTYGLGLRKEKFRIPYYAYVLSREGDHVHVPSPKYLRRVMRGARGSGLFSLLVAERNGRPVKKPRVPKGIRVRPGMLCPRKLHDQWMTKGTDRRDPQTRNRRFRTYHPLWDPCFFCSYGHDHGSDAKTLMGYAPRYGYTALKNQNENESHKGFKDIVMELPNHYLYYGIHMHISSKRRFFERRHTLVIAAVEKRSKRLVLELRFKGDFGALVVRLARGGIVGVTPKDERLRYTMRPKYKRRHRLVNIIDPRPGRLDRRWRYRGLGRMMRGEYEQWATHPMCSSIANGREPTVDIKDPLTALRTAGGRGVTYLGQKRHGKLVLAASVDREFKAKDWVISAGLCGFRPPGRVFYTNSYGTTLRKGPGRNNVRQIMTRDFYLKVPTGRYMPTDPWLGLYKKDIKAGFRNIQLGIVEKSN